MRRLILLAILALALPVASFASSVDFTNMGGTLSGSSSGLSLTGSVIIAVSGLGGGGLVTGNNLGTLSFTTGALTGSLEMGGTFAAGGSFTIAGNGTVFSNTFTGTFDSPSTWTLVTLPNGTHNYTLTGTVSGQGFAGVTVQLTTNTGKGFFDGSTTISSGDTNINTVVPEPGTLGLLGTGLVGIAGLVRRKLKVGSPRI